MTFKSVFSRFTNPKMLWGAILFYTILMGILIQFVVLPNFLPSMHAGDGLFKDVDAPKFHRLALDQYHEVMSEGWSSWELLPQGQLVVGIASAMYVIIYPAPWAVLPLNAVLNAFAGLFLNKIFNKIIREPRISLAATLPFVFFPSALLWNTQFHNENFLIPGVIFILYVWVSLVDRKDKDSKPSIPNSVAALALLSVGCILIGLTRHKVLQGLTVLAILVTLSVSIAWVIRYWRERKQWLKIPVMLVASLLMIGFEVNLHSNIQDTLVSAFGDFGGSPQGTEEIDESQSRRKNTRRFVWEKSSWLPSIIDDQLSSLAYLRNRLTRSWKNSGSAIDINVAFHNVEELIRYTPRALHISLFAPFPNLWFTEGKKVSGELTRAVSAFEMIVAYLFLLGLPVFVYKNWSKAGLWVILFFCVSMLIAFALVTPNVGTLYRFRYPFYMPLVGIGVSGWLLLARDKTPSKQVNTSAE